MVSASICSSSRAPVRPLPPILRAACGVSLMRCGLPRYGTALGIANEAEAHNDSLLPLDEVGQGSSAKDVATSAYTLFNGAGKLQGAKEGGNRELKRWRTVAISTGEMDIETFPGCWWAESESGPTGALAQHPYGEIDGL